MTSILEYPWSRVITRCNDYGIMIGYVEVIYMQVHQTICQHCGRLVPIVPGFCQLCGDPLSERTHVSLPALPTVTVTIRGPLSDHAKRAIMDLAYCSVKVA